MREPRAFAELETKIGQDDKPAQKPAFEFKDDDEKADFIMDFYNNDYAADGFQTKKLGKGLYATNHHLGDPEAEPEEISAKDLGKFFDESNLPNDTRPMEYYKGWREKHPLSKMQEAQKPATSQFVFPDDPTDPDLERGYGPRIKKVMYRGDDIQKAKEAGWSDDQIIKALIDQGYDDEEAEDFVVNFDPKRFKDPKTNPARSWEAWDQEEEYARFDQELEDAYEYIYEGLPRDRQIAVFAERMDITPEKAKAYFDSLEKRQADQKREYEANKPYRDAKAEEARKKAKEAEEKRIEGLVAKIKEARMKGDEKTAQKLVDELVFPDGLPF